jgi:hypothetical protein
MWRRSRPPIHVGVARLRGRPNRAVLVAVGVATAAGMLVGVLGGNLIAQSREVHRSIQQLPTQDRRFDVDVVGLPVQQNVEHLDRAATAALHALAPGKPLRVAFFRDFWLDGEFVRLVGIDGLSRFVDLHSGRLPSRCASVCEVLQIGGGGRAHLKEGEIELRRVGIGSLRDVSSFGAAFANLTQYRAQASLVTSTVLLAPDSIVLEHDPALRYLVRTRSWVAPIDPATIASWQIGAIVERESQAQTRLQLADPAFTLTGPDEALLDARQRNDVHGSRMVLVGGTVSALLLGFALLAAAGLRRSFASERRRLVQRGASRLQIWLAAFTEIGAITLTGWLMGIVLGAVAVGILADRLDVPAGATVRHALLEPWSLLALVACWAVAAALIAAVTLAGDETGPRRRIRLLDVVAIGAVLAVVVGITRGDLDSETLASGGGDETLLLLLPGLVCLAGAVLASRLLAPLMRLAERATRRSAAPLRLAALALARAPARTAAAGAFVVVSVGLALFASAYRETLQRSAHDEAAFAVPLDVTLTEGSKLVLPGDAATLAGYERLAPGVRAYPALRRAAGVAGVGSSAASVTVLGLAPDALARLRWRDDFSPSSRSHLVSRLSADGPAALRGPALPSGPVQTDMNVRLRGTPLRVAIDVQRPGGAIDTIPIGRAGSGDSIFRRSLGLEGGRIVAVELALPTQERNWFLHVAHEQRTVRAPAGSITLGPLRLGTQTVDVSRWISPTQSVTSRRSVGDAVRLDYSFSELETLVLRPREATDSRPLRVLASPSIARTAGPGGLLSLDFDDQRVNARIVGILDRFPTFAADDDFLVADSSRLSTTLDASTPGTGRAEELWLSVPAGSAHAVDARLASAPFSRLDSTSRRAVLSGLENDPLARAIEYTLGIAALLALVTAAVGLWMTLVGDLRDERGDFFDLEAQGVGPETIRSHLRTRIVGLLAFGIGGGLILGWVLSRLVVSLVQVSAGTGSPEPPLVLEAGWPLALATLAVLIAAVIAAVELTTRRALRDDMPLRPAWSAE